jgi:sugar O-acyltransferase (sialic acid O-acetyltransferase NeuD family)
MSMPPAPAASAAASRAPVVILGVGELAQLAHFYFTQDAGREVLAFAVDRDRLQQDSERGLPVLAFEDLPQTHPPSSCELFVAIGYSQLNAARAQRCAQARAAGYTLASYVSSRASVWPDLRMGGNCMVMEGNCLQPFVTLGEGVIMFASSVVSHHVSIGDYCFIGSEATLCGGVTVGARSFIGANATVREHLRVGSDCLIGAGALILKDTADGSGYLTAGTPDSGIPSRRLRSLL